MFLFLKDHLTLYSHGNGPISMIGFHGIGILFHGTCISFRCISLHFMNFVTFRFMSSKRDFATDGAPY